MNKKFIWILVAVVAAALIGCFAYTQYCKEKYMNGYVSGFSDGQGYGQRLSEQSVSKAASSEVVYVTATGTKFHLQGCSYLKSSSKKMLRSEAIAAGYTACSRCNP